MRQQRNLLPFFLVKISMTGYYLFMKLRKVFIIIEIIAYAVIVTCDVSGAWNANALKFAAIALCLAYSGFASARGGDKLVTAALAFTLCADVFLLLLDSSYAVGVALFCLVQGVYFVRICKSNGGRSLWSLRIALFAAAMAVLCFAKMLSPLNVLAAFYFTSFACNLLQSFSMKNRLFTIGLALFICCDICVGIHNMPNILPAAVYELAAVGMWLFYLPSQVLISLSGEKNEKSS